jgi:hypothetical protein
MVQKQLATYDLEIVSYEKYIKGVSFSKYKMGV